MSAGLIFLTVGVVWAAASVFAIRWALADMAQARLGEGDVS